MVSRRFFWISCCLILAVALTGCASKASNLPPAVTSAPVGAPAVTQAQTTTAALDGATLLATRCSVCHSADRPKQAKKTPEQWAATVNRMIQKGAQLTDAEKATLVDYLAKTFKP